MNAASPTASPRAPAQLPVWFGRMVKVMDDAVRVPGTNFRFGLDAVLGLLIPGFGDAVANLTNVFLVGFALRHGVPAPIVVRMGLNALLDAVLGAIPLFGDAADAWFKANRRNYELLQRYAQERRVRRGDWALVAVVLSLLLLAFALPMFLAGWALYAVLT